jgi:hypothetical protein
MGIKGFSVLLKKADDYNVTFSNRQLKNMIVGVDMGLMLHQALFSDVIRYLSIIFNKLSIIINNKMIPVCVF